MKKYELKHILLKYEYEAQDVLRKLQQGDNFEDLAKKFSICSTAPQGGFLGEFRPGRFVPLFEESVEELAEGQLSKPIRTQFGYHLVIKTSK